MQGLFEAEQSEALRAIPKGLMMPQTPFREPCGCAAEKRSRASACGAGLRPSKTFKKDFEI